MRVRTWPLWLAATSLALGACAQGTGGSTNKDASYDSSAEVSGELSVMGFGTDDEVATARLAHAEEVLGEEVSVDLVKGDLDIQQFLAAVAAGDAPSLVYADRTQIGTFASRKAIVPLTECIEGEGIDIDAYRDPAVEEVTFGGDVYAIPEFNVVPIVQANAELLDGAGLGIEAVNGSSWEAVAQANQALAVTEGGKISRIGYDSKMPEMLPMWVAANGGAMVSEDGRTATLDSPEVVEALEFAVGIYDAQGGFDGVKAFRDSADFFGEGNQFATDTLGAMPMEHWYVNVLNEATPDVPMAFDAFRDKQGQPLSWASGSSWAIPAGSPNPEAACRFAKAMTETEAWIKAAEERIALREEEGGMFTGLLTGNEEADAQIREMVTPSGSPVWDQAVEATYLANDHTFALPAMPAGNEFESAWQDAVNRVLNGQQEPAEAMAEAQEEAQAALDDAWQNWDE